MALLSVCVKKLIWCGLVGDGKDPPIDSVVIACTVLGERMRIRHDDSGQNGDNDGPNKTDKDLHDAADAVYLIMRFSGDRCGSLWRRLDIVSLERRDRNKKSVI